MKLPAELRGPAGKPLVIVAETPGKTVAWIPKDDGLDIFPASALKEKTFAASSTKPGRFRVLAVTAIGGEPIWGETVFIFGDAPPGPPIPPPAPPVPPPAPVDDFAKKLADAYAADASPWKRSAVKELSAIYRVMAKHARDDKDIVTSKQLLEVLNEVKKDRIPDNNVLRAMRQLIAERIAAVIGPPADAPFDRERVAAVFEQIVAALPQVN